MNESISDEAVCRTASATPGLSKMLQASPQEELFQLLHVGKGGKGGKERFCPTPGREEISSTISIGNSI